MNLSRTFLKWIAAAAALLAFASCRKPESSVATFDGAPVIVISIDTLRADHLPAWGYKGVETPAIDAFRADGVLFTNAYSHVPLTLPSHVTILTGALPYRNDVRNNVGYRFDAEKHDTIVAALKRKGYATGAAVSAYVLRAGTGIAKPFDFYDDAVGGAADVGIGQVSRPGAATAAAALQWIRPRANERFFFLLHLFEPHSPYTAPEPFRSRFSNPYDAEIATADDIVGKFLSGLKEAGVYDRAIIILLSDHGEGLGDHGESEHGVFLYREVLHVPLMVKLPGGARRGTTVDRTVQLIDIAPTIASLVGAVPAQAYAGAPLLQDGVTAHPVYSETVYPQQNFGWSALRSITDAQYHYIEAPSPELYAMDRDPGEKTNIRDTERRVFSRLRGEMEQHPKVETSLSRIEPEEAEKLAALGYIGNARNDGSTGDLRDPKDGIRDLEDLRTASRLEHEGKLALAEQGYRAIIAKSPRMSEAWLRLAALQERRGDYESAAESYRQVIAAAPALAPQVGTSAGTVLLRLGRLDEARAHAELSLENSPGGAHHLLGRVALARGDFATAEREAQAAMADKSWRGPGAVLQAVAFTQQGRFAEALSILDRTAAEYRGIGPVRDLEATRGDVLARMDRVAEAEAAFTTEIRAFPNNVDAYSRLALLYLATGNPGRANEVLEEMVRVSPTRSAYKLAAGVFRSVGSEREAERWERRAGSAQ